MVLPGYGRPRGDAGACPGGDFLTLWPAAPGPGSVGAVPWARPEEVRCLDSEGQRKVKLRLRVVAFCHNLRACYASTYCFVNLARLDRVPKLNFWGKIV